MERVENLATQVDGIDECMTAIHPDYADVHIKNVRELVEIARQNVNKTQTVLRNTMAGIEVRTQEMASQADRVERKFAEHREAIQQAGARHRHEAGQLNREIGALKNALQEDYERHETLLRGLRSELDTLKSRIVDDLENVARDLRQSIQEEGDRVSSLVPPQVAPQGVLIPVMPSPGLMGSGAPAPTAPNAAATSDASVVARSPSRGRGSFRKQQRGVLHRSRSGSCSSREGLASVIHEAREVATYRADVPAYYREHSVSRG